MPVVVEGIADFRKAVGKLAPDIKMTDEQWGVMVHNLNKAAYNSIDAIAKSSITSGK